MKIKYFALPFLLLACSVHAAESGTKPAASNASPMRTGVQQSGVQPGVPAISAGDAFKALLELTASLAEYNKMVAPLGDHYHPFSLWAIQTRQDLQALIEAAKLGTTPAETVARSNKAMPQFLKAIKVAQAIVPLDTDVYWLDGQIAQTSACLVKRQAALQQAEAKMKMAVQWAMSGMPASVSTLKSLVAEANLTCP